MRGWLLRCTAECGRQPRRRPGVRRGARASERAIDRATGRAGRRAPDGAPRAIASARGGGLDVRACWQDVRLGRDDHHGAVVHELLLPEQLLALLLDGLEERGVVRVLVVLVARGRGGGRRPRAAVDVVRMRMERVAEVLLRPRPTALLRLLLRLLLSLLLRLILRLILRLLPGLLGRPFAHREPIILPPLLRRPVPLLLLHLVPLLLLEPRRVHPGLDPVCSRIDVLELRPAAGARRVGVGREARPVLRAAHLFADFRARPVLMEVVVRVRGQRRCGLVLGPVPA